jgi:hypothetical protein
MNAPASPFATPPQPVTGAGMDRVIKRTRRQR